MSLIGMVILATLAAVALPVALPVACRAGGLLDAGRAPRPVEPAVPPLPSLLGISGHLDMPSARVLPDWRVRLSAASVPPYRHYAASLGLFDRLEIAGRVSEVTTREAFPGEGLGDYKDESADLRLVLLREGEVLPQAALGFTDLAGTGLFASRYLALGKDLGGAQLTVGLGQGVLGGESFFDDPREDDGSESLAWGFQSSSPFRRTRPFAALDLPLSEAWLPRGDWLLRLEYSSIDYRALFGQDDAGSCPVNAALAYRLNDQLTLQAGALRGEELLLAASVEAPLGPEGLFAWRAEVQPEAGEKPRRRAAFADDEELAAILAGAVARDGFTRARCRVDGDLARIRARPRQLSARRALLRLGRVAHAVLPPRVTRLSLCLEGETPGSPGECLDTGRALLAAHLEGRADGEGFMSFAHLGPDAQEWLGAARSGDERLSFDLAPRVRTFLNNRRGYFNHKLLLEASAAYEPWDDGRLRASLETTLVNGYGDVDFAPRESDPARTDVVAYERMHGTRLAELNYEHLVALPWRSMGRVAFGYFESAYAGVGAEAFRFFADGRLGLGIESETVAKRALHDQLALQGGSGLFSTLFLNLYALPFPDLGIETGIKAGRFLAGDWGARFELRRTFRHVTVGAWYTVTDTSIFQDPDNRGAHDKGVFISLPFSLFSEREVPGHFRYALTGFTSDAGQTVRQPSSLMPSSPEGLPAHTRADLLGAGRDGFDGTRP